MRSQGKSLPEINKMLNVSYGTVYRYMKDVEILPEFREEWEFKKKGSIRRKMLAEKDASIKAKALITNLSTKEIAIIISALYWAEGTKSDFSLTNSDPQLIKLFINGLKKIFNIEAERFRLSVRVYEDLNVEKCINFWSIITGLPKQNFVGIDILKGKKTGKLEYGICRVRVLKGGDMLKYLKAIKNELVGYSLSP
ncbi:MAG TPA: hypothetical protein VF185_03190 [Patescibacteria group bacterium]